MRLPNLKEIWHQEIRKMLLPVLLSRRAVFITVTAFFFLFYFLFASAPLGFPTGTLVSVEEGMTLSEVAEHLKKKSVIRSEFFFKTLVRFSSGDESVKSGDYFFKKQRNVFAVAHRLMRGLYGLDPIRVTIFEGSSVKEIAAQFETIYSDFDAAIFTTIARRDEGYLFPDTYFFLPNIKAAQVYRALRSTFDEKIVPFEDEIAASGHTLHEIITMASLVEEEASETRDRRIIAGILWKRLELDMPLQVDATFLYINGKKTFDLTLDDLLENDSPYNTYKYAGLPPGPITNPGLDSIKAALDPLETDYLYYLSDLEGNIYYSMTFEEHKRKKEMYLR